MNFSIFSTQRIHIQLLLNFIAHIGIYPVFVHYTEKPLQTDLHTIALFAIPTKTLHRCNFDSNQMNRMILRKVLVTHTEIRYKMEAAKMLNRSKSYFTYILLPYFFPSSKWLTFFTSHIALLLQSHFWLSGCHGYTIHTVEWYMYLWQSYHSSIIANRCKMCHNLYDMMCLCEIYIIPCFWINDKMYKFSEFQ